VGERWSRVGGVAPVRRVDILVGDEPWRELQVIARGWSEPARVRVDRVDLRALYAPTPDEAASWPLLPAGGVVAELGRGR
jgi:hypothetical protein